MKTTGKSVLSTVAPWLLAIVGTAVGVRYSATRMGSTAAERQQELPGDDIVDQLHLQSDHAISISAAPSQVWPWLVQLGQDRGGFYSFEVLENLIGCDIHGSSEVNPEWQVREVGDKVLLAPGVSLRVAESEPNGHLVLAGDEDSETPPGMPYKFSWAFVLTPEGEGTRLHVRERYQLSTSAERVGYNGVVIASWIMTQKMLHTIRCLSEQTA